MKVFNAKAVVILLALCETIVTAFDEKHKNNQNYQQDQQQAQDRIDEEVSSALYPHYMIRHRRGRRGASPMTANSRGLGSRISKNDIVESDVSKKAVPNKRIIRRLNMDETIYEECSYDSGTASAGGHGKGSGKGYGDRKLAVGYSEYDYGEYNCDGYGKGGGKGYGKGGDYSGKGGYGYGKGGYRQRRRTGACVCNECGCYEYCVVDYGDTGDDPICSPEQPEKPEGPKDPPPAPEVPGTNPSMDTGLPEYAYSNDFGDGNMMAAGGGGDDVGSDTATPNRDDNGGSDGSDPAIFLGFAPPPPQEVEEPDTTYYVVQEEEKEEATKAPYYIQRVGDP